MPKRTVPVKPHKRQHSLPSRERIRTPKAGAKNRAGEPAQENAGEEVKRRNYQKRTKKVSGSPHHFEYVSRNKKGLYVRGLPKLSIN